MSSFITDSEKNEIKRAFQALHDTFKREIIIHKTAKNEILVSTKINSTNPMYKRNIAGKTEIVNTPVYLKTFARIYYKTDQIKQLFDGNDNSAFLSLPISDGEVKIVLDEEAFVFLDGAERIELDGIKFYIKSDIARKGMFSPIFYNIYLSRKQ